ncbi:MAG TPA: plastocyanin/azurin family copper-binding protein [Nocardioidaceae bacterium]|nr:plastocyanin/azurin family copper-binding protein [Nocardioidaceae bacterium]
MPIRPMRTVLVALIALVASVLVGAAPATPATAKPAHKTWDVWVGSESKNLAIQGMRFLPGSITINAGDNVAWMANSAEIHTVTFFKGGHPRKKLPEFDPNKKRQITQVGGHVYDTSKYFNSGIITTIRSGGDAGPLPPVPHYQKYKLRFPRAGTFTYYCLVHGTMMVGKIKVQPKGSKYPFTQAQYTAQAQSEARALLAQGRQLRRETVDKAGPRRVMAGNDDNAVMLMRFVNRTVRVKVGQSVTWVSPGMLAPHTVTFGKEPPPPGLFGPSGNPRNFTGGALNSGIIPPGGKFRVTFKKAGTYRYVCALHDPLGMVGRVIVER